MTLQHYIRISLRMKIGKTRGFCSHPGRVLTFDEVQHMRRTQAKRSLLVQVQSVKSAGALGAYIQQHGSISSMYHFGANKKEFLFVEMSSEEEAERLIGRALHPALDAVVPVSSPLMWFRAGGGGRAGPAAAQDASLPPVIQEPSRSQAELAQRIASCQTLDEQLVLHHELTCLTELGSRLRYFTCGLVERAISGLFPRARARPFGSSANGFGRHDCDVDMALELAPPRESEALERLAFQSVAAKPDGRHQSQRYLTIIGDLLSSLMPGCEQVRRILRATVPIVKYTQAFTGVDCDLTLNVNGLHMTELLYIWNQLDPRVAPLVRAIRHWADKIHITQSLSGSSGAGRWISNFGLTLLVIYFLQTRPVPVLPSVNELTQRARPCDRIQDSDGGVYTFLRDPSLVPPTTNTESLSELLAGFFRLYSDLELDGRGLSVVWASQVPRPPGGALHVENPLSRELNVTKNVSGDEVLRLAAEARRAAALLAEGRWWELVLGGEVPAAPVQRFAPLSLKELFEEEDGLGKGNTGKVRKAESVQEVKGMETRRVQKVNIARLFATAQKGAAKGRVPEPLAALPSTLRTRLDAVNGDEAPAAVLEKKKRPRKKKRAGG